MREIRTVENTIFGKSSPPHPNLEEKLPVSTTMEPVSSPQNIPIPPGNQGTTKLNETKHAAQKKRNLLAPLPVKRSVIIIM